MKAYKLWLTDFPSADEKVKAEWLARFAKAGGVSESHMIREMKAQESTDK